MDEKTAHDLIGQERSFMVDGRREDGAMVMGLNVSSGHPTTMDLLLRTPIGEPDRRVRIPLSKVELAL